MIQTSPGRRLKNGCVEFVDESTGQRTRVAGDRTYGLLAPAAELFEASSEHSMLEIEGAKTEEALSKPIAQQQRGNKGNESAWEASNVLGPTSINNTPHLLKQAESEGETPFPIESAKRKRRGEENIRHGGENLQEFYGDDPFLIRHPNFSVLNKEIIHKRNGQGGFSGNVEKIRVEMESLEDGYKCVSSLKGGGIN